MKLVYSNGRVLEVRDAGPVLMRLRAGTCPIRFNGYHLLEDEAAREQLRDLLASGLYERDALEGDAGGNAG